MAKKKTTPKVKAIVGKNKSASAHEFISFGVRPYLIIGLVATLIVAGFVILLSATNAAPLAACKYVTLKYGMNHVCTKQIQYYMHVPTTPPYTTYFGPRTRDVVKSIQHSNGLPANGIVDFRTWNAICRYIRVNTDTASGRAPKIGCIGKAYRSGGMYYYTGAF